MSNRADALVHQAQRIPTKAAVIFEGHTWTFAQLLDQAQAYAAGLAQAGRGQERRSPRSGCRPPIFPAASRSAQRRAGTRPRTIGK